MRLDDLSGAEKRWRKVVLFRDHRPPRRRIGWLWVGALVCASLLSLALGGLDLRLDGMSRADLPEDLGGDRSSGGGPVCSPEGMPC